MAEPVTPSDDYFATRGNGRYVSVRFYNSVTDGWGVAVTNVFAVRFSGLDEFWDVNEGTVRRSTNKYGLRLADLPSRPPIKSLILDGSDTWVMDTAEDTSPLDAVLTVPVTKFVGTVPV